MPQLAASIAVRLRKRRAPAAFDGWPLGYRVLTFDHSGATIAVWHLDVASSSALELASVDYETTTYRLRQLSGGWRIEHVTTMPGPAPPPPTAPARELDAFARAAAAFSTYRYVP